MTILKFESDDEIIAYITNVCDNFGSVELSEKMYALMELEDDKDLKIITFTENYYYLNNERFDRQFDDLKDQAFEQIFS